MTSIRVNMVPAHKNGYGFVAESDTAFRANGTHREWHNNHNCRVVVRKFEQITLDNGDLYGEDLLILSSIPTVISRYKTGAEKSNGGEIAIGDEIIVNDVTYVVTVKNYSEPILVKK